MSRPPLEVADFIRTAGAAFLERNCRWITWKHVKVLLAIARCRTAALGGHLDQCTGRGHRATISYNSCRNRHCPKCQTSVRETWIAARQRELFRRASSMWSSHYPTGWHPGSLSSDNNRPQPPPFRSDLETRGHWCIIFRKAKFKSEIL